MRVCSKCGYIKPEDNFAVNKKRKDGLFTYCKRCKSKVDGEYYIKHRQKIMANSRDYYHKKVEHETQNVNL